MPPYTFELVCWRDHYERKTFSKTLSLWRGEDEECNCHVFYLGWTYGSVNTSLREITCDMCIQVVPGRAGGGSFKRKKNYIAKKEFAYRMCARWPTIAMSKFFSEVWTKLLPLHGCHVMRFGVMCLWFDLLSNDVASCEVICGTTPTYYSSTTLYSVLQSTTPVLLCTTKYYSSTTLYYKVLLQYYSPVLQRTTLYYKVLQSTTPVLLCTTKYYSSTTLYYKVLLCTTKYYKVLRQYYSVLQSTTPVLLCTTPVLQSTTPVLLCTTKYYSSTTLYDKVLLRYYSVLQSTTTCTTKYYSSTTLYYKVLRQYYSVLRQYYNLLLRYYFETSFTMRGATRVSVQLHQILRLPRKMNVINDLRHIWNVISNAWSKSSHPPTSPNTAPTTKSWSSRFQRILPECFRQ